MATDLPFPRSNVDAMADLGIASGQRRRWLASGTVEVIGPSEHEERKGRGLVRCLVMWPGDAEPYENHFWATTLSDMELLT